MPKPQYQVYIAPGARGASGVRGRAAVRALNQQLGAKVVKLVRDPSKADVVVRAGNPRQDYGGYMATRGKKRDRITVDRRLLGAQGSTGKYRKNLLGHEIGHGLGLEHTKGARNLMNPSITGQNLSRRQSRGIRQGFNQGQYL